MSNDLKKQLIKLGSTNPALRPHIRPVLASIEGTANLKGNSQTGGSPKTPEDRKLAEVVKKALVRAGLWQGNRWEYFTSNQGGVDPSGSVGYSTYDVGDDYFSMGIGTFGPDVGDVTVQHSGGEYEYFPNLNAAQRWLQKNFSGSIRNAGAQEFSVGDVVLYGSSKAVVVAFVAFGDMVIKLERGKEVIAGPEQLILVKKA